MRKSTVAGALAAAGAASAVGRFVDRQFGPPDPESGSGRRWLRTVNKRITNPFLLRVADFHLPYLTIVGHVGRRTGSDYRTPVAASPSASGFIIPLPYGRDVDWCQNLIAGGGGTLRQNEDTFLVRNPRFIDQTEALAAVDARHRAIWSRLGITNFLLLEPTADGAGG